LTALDFWFEFGSTYSYLSATRIAAVASAVGVEVRWQPFLLGPLFREFGWNDSPFNLYPAKGRYMWRDIERLCLKHHLDFCRPTVFPRNSLQAARIATAAVDEPWLADFVRAAYRSNFAEDRDISDSNVLGEILTDLGESADAVLARAGTPKNRTRLRELTDEARKLGIFGAPSLVVGNELFMARTVGVGIIPPEKALEYGLSGPNLRASGIAWDLRKEEPHLPYPEVEFDVISAESGDCNDRYVVRLNEIREAAKIVLQAIDKIRPGPLVAKVPRIIKVPKGQTYVRGENPKGEFGYYLISEGGQKPYRLKIRSTSFSNLSILPWILEGQLVPDLVAIMGSLDFVLGDVDR